MPDIISIGESMVEFYAEGSLAEARTFERSWGGDTANVLVAASHLGSSTGYITKLGNDPFASALLAEWAQIGIDVSLARVVPGFTGLYFITLLEDGQRDFTYYRTESAASTLTPGDVSADYIAGAKVLHLSGIAQAISTSCRETTLAAARLAKNLGLKVSYDPNFRPSLTGVLKAQSAFEEILPYTDVVLASAPEETGQLLSAVEPEVAVKYLWEKGIGTVVVKMGRRGCLVGYDRNIAKVEAYDPGYVVDTTGAGDAFDGAFLHCLTRGATPLEAARVAVVMAALKCRGRGAVASMPDREDVERALGYRVP